jgi:hypothetical protein
MCKPTKPGKFRTTKPSGRSAKDSMRRARADSTFNGTHTRKRGRTRKLLSGVEPGIEGVVSARRDLRPGASLRRSFAKDVAGVDLGIESSDLTWIPSRSDVLGWAGLFQKHGRGSVTTHGNLAGAMAISGRSAVIRAQGENEVGTRPSQGGQTAFCECLNIPEKGAWRYRLLFHKVG